MHKQISYKLSNNNVKCSSGSADDDESGGCEFDAKGFGNGVEFDDSELLGAEVVMVLMDTAVRMVRVVMVVVVDR